MSGTKGQGGHEKRGCMGGKEEHILERLAEEDEREETATGDAREITRELLLDKGFPADEVLEQASFDVVSADGTVHNVTADFLVSVDGNPLMAIKCSMALESRERHVLAFARSVQDHPIAFCTITDGLKFHVIETSSGKLLSETSEEFPERAALARMASEAETGPLDPERRARETMVLLAFEVASCPRIERK